jgi:hypothetical protein
MTEPKWAQMLELDPKATLLGIARCSESEPYCTAVQRRDNGDIILANQVGAQFVIPAGEALEVLTLALRGLAP